MRPARKAYGRRERRRAWLRHENGISRFRDGGVHKNAVGADFHGDRCIARSADARIDDHGTSVMRSRKMRKAAGFVRRGRSDWRGEGMMAEAPASISCVRRSSRRLCRAERQTFLDQDASGFNQLFRVGIKGLLVANHFKLDPIRKTHFPAEPSGANGFVGGVTCGGVWQDEHFVRAECSRGAIPWTCREIDTANGDGDHVRAAGGVSASHFRKTAVLPSSYDQARRKSAACDDELV